MRLVADLRLPPKYKCSDLKWMLRYRLEFLAKNSNLCCDVLNKRTKYHHRCIIRKRNFFI